MHLHSFLQYVTFYGKRDGFFSSGRMKAKTTSGMVIYHSIGDVKPGQTQLWQNQSIEIPPIPPSGLDGCNIIDITYSLVVSILNLYHMKLSIKINYSLISTNHLYYHYLICLRSWLPDFPCKFHRIILYSIL